MTYANDMPTLASASLAADLRIALLRSARRIRAERSSESISDGQYSVLARLDCDGVMTPRQLAEADHVQPPSMTRILNALVAAGLVERTGDPDDRRQVLVAITEAGRAEVRETRRRRDAWLAQRLAVLTPQERATLADAADILRRVVAK